VADVPKLKPGEAITVDTAKLPWRNSTFAKRVTVKDVARTGDWELQLVRLEPGAHLPSHTHELPEFLYVLAGELIQNGEKLGPGWATVSTAGSIDPDVHTETGCTFVLVDRA
jgi:anti-sigma factor ChrR (cupin superfamily)